MLLRPKLFSLMIAVLLVFSASAFIQVVSATELEIVIVDEGQDFLKGMVTINGTSTTVTVADVNAIMKVTEINGVPQASSKIEHPLIISIPSYQVVGDRWVRTIPAGAEALITKWRWMHSFYLPAPHTAWQPTPTYHIYLDPNTANDEYTARGEIIILAYFLKIKLVQLGVSSDKAEGVLDLAYALCYGDYNRIYSEDANPDGSIDFYIPIDSYNVQCAQRTCTVFVTTQYCWWLTGSSTTTPLTPR